MRALDLAPRKSRRTAGTRHGRPRSGCRIFGRRGGRPLPGLAVALRRRCEGVSQRRDRRSAKDATQHVLAGDRQRGSSLLIGDATIGIGSVPNKRAEIGFTLRRDRWGAGLATEAAQLLLAFGFDQLGMHRIEATSHPDNVASIRVLEKIGMSLEGCIRDHLFVNGAWRDSLAFSILEPEWRAQVSA